MSKIKANNYFTIQGWMVEDLKLKGNELMIYAIIYGFSQEENSKYTGSIQYLADWTNSTKQGVIKNLKSLVEKGYITKEEKMINGIKFCEYGSGKQSLPVLNKVDWGGKQSLPGGGKQSLPNNIDINIIDNNIDNKKEKIKKEKYFINDEVNDLFIEFLQMRKKMKAINSDRAITQLINKLKQYDDSVKIEMINNAIVNSWKSVYPIQNIKQENKKSAYEKRQELYARLEEELK